MDIYFFRPISRLLLCISPRLFMFFLFQSQLLHFFFIFPRLININMGKTVSSDLLCHLTNPPGICHAVSIFDIYLQIFYEWSLVMRKIPFISSRVLADHFMYALDVCIYVVMYYFSTLTHSLGFLISSLFHFFCSITLSFLPFLYLSLFPMSFFLTLVYICT